MKLKGRSIPFPRAVSPAHAVATKAAGAFFAHSPQAALVCDRAVGVVLAANPAAARLYGFAPEEMGGLSFESLFGEAILPFSESPHEARHRRRDGTCFAAETRAAPLRGGRFLLFVSDLTEKKELEERTLRAQRLECIGSLASGVAHDLNNILAPIVISASMLHEELPADARREFLEAIEQSARRGVDLLRQVLTFAKGVEGERTPLRPEALVEEVARLARHTFPKSIEIESRLGPKLWEIEGNATRLHQVLLNLIVNARDAMGEGGRIVLSARNRQVGAARAARIRGGAAGRYVAFSVHDSGPGVPRELLSKIFDPFFTTKEDENGTGLGLPTVASIAKSHGGFVEVASPPGKGSTFTVCLPARASRQAGSRARFEGGSGPRSGWILVVDDDPNVRRMVHSILSRNGYRVVLAEDGRKALSKFTPRRKAFGLALVDLKMPSMDGFAVAKALRELDPKARIIATSGAQPRERLRELASLGVTRFLRKPYLSTHLLSVVSEVIGKP